MLSTFIDRAKVRMGQDVGRVVLAEGEAPRIIQAAALAAEFKVARPLLLGSVTRIADTAQGLGVPIEGIEMVDPTADDRVGDFAAEYCAANPGFPAGAARLMFTDPLPFAAMLVRTGAVDAMVAGLQHATAEVLLVSQLIIGMQEGIETASSMFLMDIPGYEGGEDGLLAFADCAVIPMPTAEQLADITIATAHTVRHLLGWEPRVALLSFSTKGSGQDPSIDRVTEALGIVHRREPALSVDGELQVDTAIVPEVAATKLPGGGPIAGRANVLIFPDLNAGNIGYKLVQRLSGAGAYGPLLQGFAGTVSDLSRGATTDDIVAAIAMTSMSVGAHA
ncbi:MAG: phosphate acyltransferase [Candidatus Nanopelagicales bacterium]|nr:phosphate acyltransferase [Candidatus Nanopelagicales bacterium]